VTTPPRHHRLRHVNLELSAWLQRHNLGHRAPEAGPEPTPATTVRWVGRYANFRHPADLFRDMTAGRKDVVVVDARWPEGWSTEHIPGAINLFARNITPETTAGMRKDVEYVVYCWNESCHASTMAAAALEKLGFTAHELHGGLQKWKSEGFPTERTEPK
jgi:rhodanese-related sulfurtransferase